MPSPSRGAADGGVFCVPTVASEGVGMLEVPSTVLVLAPHTDDGEFGAGGTISLWLEQGHDIHYLAFSSCEESLPEGYDSQALVREVKAATASLGIAPQNLHILDFPVRRFSEHRQSILQAMIDIDRLVAPDVVLSPSTEDLHQDHSVVAWEGLRAFKRRTVLAYEVPWNNIQFRSSAFSILERRHVEAKVRAITCYESQRARAYSQRDFLEAQMRFRGTQIGAEFAETFDTVRWLI